MLLQKQLTKTFEIVKCLLVTYLPNFFYDYLICLGEPNDTFRCAKW